MGKIAAVASFALCKLLGMLGHGLFAAVPLGKLIEHVGPEIFQTELVVTERVYNWCSYTRLWVNSRPLPFTPGKLHDAGRLKAISDFD